MKQEDAPLAPLVEISHCPDVYVTGIARIEHLTGGALRVILHAEQQGPTGYMERVVVARLIGSVDNIPTIIRQLVACLADMPLMSENGTVSPLN